MTKTEIFKVSLEGDCIYGRKNIHTARHLRVGVTKLEVIPGYKITRKQESSFTQSFTQIYSFIQVIQV